MDLLPFVCLQSCESTEPEIYMSIAHGLNNKLISKHILLAVFFQLVPNVVIILDNGKYFVWSNCFSISISNYFYFACSACLKLMILPSFYADTIFDSYFIACDFIRWMAKTFLITVCYALEWTTLIPLIWFFRNKMNELSFIRKIDRFEQNHWNVYNCIWTFEK